MAELLNQQTGAPVWVWMAPFCVWPARRSVYALRRSAYARCAGLRMDVASLRMHRDQPCGPCTCPYGSRASPKVNKRQSVGMKTSARGDLQIAPTSALRASAGHTPRASPFCKSAWVTSTASITHHASRQTARSFEAASNLRAANLQSLRLSHTTGGRRCVMGAPERFGPALCYAKYNQ